MYGLMIVMSEGLNQNILFPGFLSHMSIIAINHKLLFSEFFKIHWHAHGPLLEIT